MKRLLIGLCLLVPSTAMALPADLEKLGDDKERELERKRRIAGEPGSGLARGRWF